MVLRRNIMRGNLDYSGQTKRRANIEIELGEIQEQLVSP